MEWQGRERKKREGERKNEKRGRRQKRKVACGAGKQGKRRQEGERSNKEKVVFEARLWLVLKVVCYPPFLILLCLSESAVLPSSIVF